MENYKISRDRGGSERLEVLVGCRGRTERVVGCRGKNEAIPQVSIEAAKLETRVPDRIHKEGYQKNLAGDSERFCLKTKRRKES